MKTLRNQLAKHNVDLDREAVRELSSSELAAVAGGASTGPIEYARVTIRVHF